MKKNIFILFLLCSNLMLAQQPFFYTQPVHNSEIFKVISLPNKQYAYLAKNSTLPYSSWGREQFFIGILDSNLTQIKSWGEGILPKHEILIPLGFSYANNRLFITYNHRSCDAGNYGVQMFYVDLATNAANLDFWNLKEGIKQAAQTESGYILGQAGKSVNSFQIFDKEHSFDIISLDLKNDIEVDLLFAGKNHFYFRANKNNLISTDERGENIKILGSSTPLESRVPQKGEEIVPNKKIVYRILDTLYYLDFQKNISKKRKLKNAESVFTFEPTKQELVISNDGIISVLDTNFNWIREEQSKIKVNGFINHRDSVYFYGSEFHMPESLYKYFYSGLSVFKPFKKEERKLELKIEQIEFENNPPIITKPTNSLGQTVQFGTIKIAIRNTGNDTIKSCNLNNWHDQNSFICDDPKLQTWKFSNIIIPPNQTKQVSLPNVVLNNTFKQKNDQLCLWVSLVNNEPDKNLRKNEVCKVFENLLAAENVTTERNGLSIFPNPSDAQVQIQTLNDNETLQQIQLTDMNGRIVLSQYVDNQQLVTLNVANFPIGLYVLQIKQAEKWIITKLVIKD